MSEHNSTDFETFLRSIQKQYLCCYPLHCIVWETFPKDMTWDEQKDLIDATYNSPLNQKLPIKIAYQLNFLKKLIAFLEQTTSEVHDAVYESYCDVQLRVAEDSTQKYAFKHYLLDEQTHFTLRESKSFVAEGTTGLCSWQASLALSDFILRHPDIVRNRRILELGAGTGLCGFILFKMCQPQQLMISDGSPQCVELMCESVERNFPDAHLLNSNGKYSWNEQILQCSVISWNCINECEEVVDLCPEILLAADVVYDDSCFDDLSFAIDFAFKLRNNQVEMYLAATVRNEHTLNGFLKKLGE
ncbi:protein-lysine N-methyltransferase EEF2KMT isoform X2 [Musca autumnalis]|uniref:protein-lysine N-methyltransferase EEF2KMT isoform X2 n=1 Tax=Musca autumnalis TaxID=221902 RepID=UPI003CFBBBEE